MQSESETNPEMKQVGARPSPGIVALLVAIVIGGFVIRAYHPLSRSQLWPNRAESFYSAIRDQRWDSTYQSRHPGVTTMAVGALTYFVFDQVEGTALEGLFTWGALPWASKFGVEVAIGMVGLSLVIGLLFLSSALLLKRLGGWPLAIAGLVLATFSPFYLAQSRVFHVDALASTLMLVSALLLLVYLKQGTWRHLILSGLTGGLAVLTKSPAVFLVPYVGLGLLVYTALHIAGTWFESARQKRARVVLGALARRLVGPLLVWILAAILVFPLWPALWENPQQIFDTIVTGATEHVENPHINERFFAGHIYINQPPPWTYYPTSVMYRTTFVTLFFVLLSLLLATIWRRRRLLPIPPPTYWLLVAYVVFFTIQMTISAKQVDRYVLPAQLMLEIIAAVGVIGLGNVIRGAAGETSPTRMQSLFAVALAVPLGLHLLVTLPFFPDFGAHYNYLLGGNRGAFNVFSFQGQNEGVFEIVKYMLDHPDIRVSASNRSDSIWLQFDVGDEPTSEYTHELISVVDVRRRRTDIERLVADYASQTPELTVSFDNVVYFWLYPTTANPDITTTQIHRGWAGFTIVAWIASIGFVAALFWGLRKQPNPLSTSSGLKSEAEA